MWKEYQRHNNHLLLILFSFPNLGCLVAKKTQLFYCFSNCFQWIFLRKKKWLILHSFISQFLIYLGLNETHFLLIEIQEEDEIEFGVDSKSALKEEGVQPKVKGASQVVQEGLVGLSQVKPYIQCFFFIVDIFYRLQTRGF